MQPWLRIQLDGKPGATRLLKPKMKDAKVIKGSTGKSSDLRMAKVQHGEEKKVGKVQALAALSYVPKTGYTLPVYSEPRPR